MTGAWSLHGPYHMNANTAEQEERVGGNPVYETGLDRNEANFAPLNPVTFLERAAYIYPDRTAVIHGAWRSTWQQTYARCRRLASALTRHRHRSRRYGRRRWRRTRPRWYEAHFGVPMTGAVLNTLNTRLDAETIAFMLRARRGEGADRRQGILRRPSRRRSALLEDAAAGDRHRRSAHARTEQVLGEIDVRGVPRAAAIRTSRGSIRPTNGTRSRSTTPRARPAIRKASSTTIAAPT